MNLTIALSAAIASDRSTVTTTDDTVYGTRSNYYVYFNAYKMAYDNSATQLTTDNSLPNTVTSWSTTYDSDGWFKSYFAAFQAWSSGTTYAQYDAVYRSGSVYVSTQAGNLNHDPSNPTYWTLVSDPATLANNKGETNESLNIDSVVYQRVFSANGQYAFDLLVSKASTCTDCDQAALLQKYNLLAEWLDAIAIADAREEVLKGELIARRVQSVYVDIC